tara:strand:- start:1196 stop:2026 length:831 start_codon:yes stop_codon:yes gene_type:complete
VLDRITPVILTYNEEANIGRCLAALSWAREVVVVDSHSDDGTEAIVRGFANTRFIQRRFDDHPSQWRFALEETGIESDWLLRLDADYLVPAALRQELAGLAPADGVSGYRAGFDYCVHGRKLRASLYPPNMVLVRRGAVSVVQDGHTERVGINQGAAAMLKNRLRHDDRKPMARFVWSQVRYQARERDKLLQAPRGTLGPVDRLRRWIVVTPWLVLLYCLFFRGLVLDGRAGLAYSLQRMLAETILSLYLVESALQAADRPPAGRDHGENSSEGKI